MKVLNQFVAASAFGLFAVTGAQAVPIAADVIFVVDESGSMAGEHAWLSNMIVDLENGLTAAGVGTGAAQNNYALVGYGAYSGHGVAGHKHTVGGGDWGNATEFGTATGGLIVSGGTEDGWEAIDFALNNYSFRNSGGADYALNIILITDEDRDNIDASLNYAGMLNSLSAAGGVLNSVVNCSLYSGSGIGAVGVDSNANAYTADGAGGFNKSSGGYYNAGSCFGTTESDYVDLAWDTGGAAWDLNQLRAGGLTATSFTNAFVDVKVEEIIIKTPEPGSLALIGLGLLGMGFARKRSARKIAA